MMQASGRGTLVVSSLHCPAASWSTYFSHMLLLTADGRMAYQGPYGKVGRRGYTYVYICTHIYTK